MDKEEYLNILDLGNYRIRFSVFDKNSKSRFSKNIPINFDCNYSHHFKDIGNLIKIAEKEISSYIENIILTLDNHNLFSFDISLTKKLNSNLEIKKIYEMIFMELKQIINFNYPEYEIIHIIIDNCIIDKKHYFDLPDNGIKTDNMKIDFKLICFPKKLINEIRNNFSKNNLKIKNIFCTSYIKSYSYLKNIGRNNISFLDIGYKRCSLLTYQNEKLKFIQTIPIGSFHITQDISKVLKVDFDLAENLKKYFNLIENNFLTKRVNKDKFNVEEVFKKKISKDLLKKVILYRVQEIIDVTYKRSDGLFYNYNISDHDLFLLGEGSILFSNNSFNLEDRFEFNSINFYKEKDVEICKSAIPFHLEYKKTPEINNKKWGLFEKFFNFFSR